MQEDYKKLDDIILFQKGFFNGSIVDSEKRKVIRALDGMLEKGFVSMEELRQEIGEIIPYAFTIGAKAMGLSCSEMLEKIQNKEIESTEFIPKFLDGLIETYGVKWNN